MFLNASALPEMFPWLLLAAWVGGQALLGSRSDCSLGVSAEAAVKQPCGKCLEKVVNALFLWV